MYLFFTFSSLLVCFVDADFFFFFIGLFCVCVCVCVCPFKLIFFSPLVFFMCSFHFISSSAGRKLRSFTLELYINF